MKKLLKKIVVFLATAVLAVSCFSFIGSAEGTTIVLSKKSLAPGETLTVTVTVSSAQAMYGAEFSLNYDPAVLQYNSGDASSGGAGLVKVASAASGETRKSFSINFTAIAAGNSNLSVSAAKYASDTEVDISGASASVSVINATLSDNANLKSLRISGGTLSPQFNANTTSYTATVPFSVTQCKVYATAAESNAKVDVSGSYNIPVGVTQRVVTVTAPSGAQKAYTITITRLAEEAAESAAESGNESAAENSNAAEIDGKSYTVMSDLTGITIPKGFNASSAVYNGNNVASIKDENGEYEIYYMKSAESEEPVLFTFNSEDNKFEPLKYMYIGDSLCIFAEPEVGTPDGYYTTTASINGFTVKCFALSKQTMSDFYIVRCYRDGSYKYYRYDSKEGTLQREPDFTVEKTESVKAQGNLAERFSNISATGKVIITCVIIAVLAVIALVVLFAVKLIKEHRSITPSEVRYDEPFDSIIDGSSFSFTPDGENGESDGEENDK